MLWTLGLCRPCSQFLEIVNNLLTRGPFIWEQNQYRIHTHITYRALTLEASVYPPPPLHPRPLPGTRQMETTPTHQSPLKLFTLSNPKPVYPALPVPSLGNHNKCSCSWLPLSFSACWLTLAHLGVTPHGMACPFLRGIVSNKLSFQWQLSPDLLASPYVNNKTCVLEQIALV